MTDPDPEYQAALTLCRRAIIELQAASSVIDSHALEGALPNAAELTREGLARVALALARRRLSALPRYKPFAELSPHDAARARSITERSS